YQIGQHFKGLAKDNADGKLTTKQEAAHILSHAVLGAAVAAAGGNDAMTAAVAAGGAEAVAPVVSNWLYGEEDGSKLTAEQKETVSAIAGLAGSAVGTATGNAADVAQGNQTSINSIENNQTRPFNLNDSYLKQLDNMSGAFQTAYKATGNIEKAMDAAKKVGSCYGCKNPGSDYLQGLVMLSLASPVVVIGGKTYAFTAISSVTQGAFTAVVIEGQQYKLSDLSYDASLGIIIGKGLDKYMDKMLMWSGTENKFLERSLDIKKQIINYGVGKAGEGTLDKFIGNNNIILLEVPDWRRKIDPMKNVKTILGK
ncbi:VENN motif pre-toxin domain-containing protein, partial [Neisseria animalis]